MTTFIQHFKKAAITTAILSCSYAAQANVLTSIKPLGFIASSIADGVTETEVLVPAGASPHDYHLKPSDVLNLKKADLVLWIGEDVDGFLDKTIDSLDQKKVITIEDLNIQSLLGKVAEHHHDHGDHDHDHDHHKHEHKDADHKHHNDKHDDDDGLETNWHVWFSPEISKVVAAELAHKLAEQYPQKKALIEANLAEFNQSVAVQSEKIKQELAPVKDKGFYVFHDAYGYFNEAYGLKQTGYFTINPLVAPGAKTLAKIKEEIEEHKVACLFAEPQFTPKVIESLSKGTNVKVGHLDPMADAVQLGKNSYANFLRYTALSYLECLAK